jgi:hypothetical protein
VEIGVEAEGKPKNGYYFKCYATELNLFFLIAAGTKSRAIRDTVGGEFKTVSILKFVPNGAGSRIQPVTALTATKPGRCTRSARPCTA